MFVVLCVFLAGLPMFSKWVLNVFLYNCHVRCVSDSVDFVKLYFSYCSILYSLS